MYCTWESIVSDNGWQQRQHTLNLSYFLKVEPLAKTTNVGALVAEFVASSTNADAIGRGVPKTRFWRNAVMQEVLDSKMSNMW